MLRERERERESEREKEREMDYETNRLHERRERSAALSSHSTDGRRRLIPPDNSAKTEPRALLNPTKT